MRTGLLVAALFVALIGVSEAEPRHPHVERCRPHQLLEGIGVRSDGRWSRYACVDRRDLEEAVAESICSRPSYWWNQKAATIRHERCAAGFLTKASLRGVFR